MNLCQGSNTKIRSRETRTSLEPQSYHTCDHSCSLSSFLACNSRLRSAIRRHHPPQRAFWVKSAASGSVRWCCFRSCWTVLSHVMRGRPSCLLQSARVEANRILLASALSSMRIICPNRVSRRDLIIGMSLGCCTAKIKYTPLDHHSGQDRQLCCLTEMHKTRQVSMSHRYQLDSFADQLPTTVELWYPSQTKLLRW